MGVLQYAMQVVVIVPVFFIKKCFSEFAVGQFFYKVGKTFGIGPCFVKQGLPVCFSFNGSMFKAAGVFCIQCSAGQNFLYSTDIIINMKYKGCNGIKARNFCNSCFSVNTGQLFFKAYSCPVAAKMNLPYMSGYL